MTNEETFTEMLDRMKAECESCQYYYHCTYDRRIGFPFAMPNPMLYGLEERQKIYEHQKESSKKPCISYLSRNRVDEALEKQISKKPIVIQKGKVEEGGCYGVFYCPSCYELDGNKDWKCKVIFDQSYCECCGQKIDWSEYD